MSPKDFATVRVKRLLLTGGALVSAVIVITGPIAAGATKIDARYVKQQSYDTDKRFDSLTHRQETDSIFRMMRKHDEQEARVDSSLRCITRRVKPDYCG